MTTNNRKFEAWTAKGFIIYGPDGQQADVCLRNEHKVLGLRFLNNNEGAAELAACTRVVEKALRDVLRLRRARDAEGLYPRERHELAALERLLIDGGINPEDYET